MSTEPNIKERTPAILTRKNADCPTPIICGLTKRPLEKCKVHGRYMRTGTCEEVGHVPQRSISEHGFTYVWSCARCGSTL